jgi:hypothetical protein
LACAWLLAIPPWMATSLRLGGFENGPVVPYGPGFGLAMWLLLVLSDPVGRARGGLPPVIGLAILALFMGCGTISTLNESLDRSEAQEYRTTVVGKNVYRGSRGHVSYALFLGRWDGMPFANRLDVPESYWRSMQLGDAVCLARHDGAFGIRWGYIIPCR